MNNPILLSERFERAVHIFNGGVEMFARADQSEPIAAFCRAVENFQIQINRLAKIQGMVAENEDRKQRGLTVTYTEGSFLEV